MLSKNGFVAIAIAVVGLIASWPALALGGVIVSLNNEGSAQLHEIEVAPGGTFGVEVNLSTTTQTIEVWFDLGASESNCFDVIGVTDQAPWNSSPFPSMVGGLDPQARMWTGLPLWEVFGPGTTTLGTIQLGVDLGCPQGTYPLDVLGGRYRETWVDTGFGFVTGGPTFTVRVVPEPGCLALSSLVFGLLSSRKRGRLR